MKRIVILAVCFALIAAPAFSATKKHKKTAKKKTETAAPVQPEAAPAK